MATVSFDFRDFELAARRMRAAQDQIPFALAQAMNDGLRVAREQIVERTWPSHVQVRNTRFMGVALRGEFASKSRLRVTLYDRIGRGNLVLHEEGGSRRPRGTAIAVPAGILLGRRGSHGVPKGLRPRNLPNSFVTDGRRPNGHLKQGAIYQREGSYHKKGSKISARPGKTQKAGADGRTVKLMYTLKPSVPIKADVPFHQDFDRVMRREVWGFFRPRLNAAMAGRRR